jgi:Ca2+-binding RTX toxin-like protein
MIYNVKDFGAKGDGVTNDTSAIQAAVNAARAAGGGSVYIPSGTYIVSGGASAGDGCIMIYDNTTVYGDGMGATTIKLRDGWNKDVTGIFRDSYGVPHHDITVHDLTIDGNRANNTGKIIGWFSGVAPGINKTDLNITLDHLEIKNCGSYGFDPHEQTTNLVITNCISHDNGLDGFTLDYVISGRINNNVAYNNGRHGFNVCTRSHDIELAGNIAYGNGAQGLMVQRGGENIPVPYNIFVRGGSYHHNKGDGIRINIAKLMLIDGADIHDNGQRGVRIRGSYGSTIQNCRIHDNSTAGNGSYEEIRVESLSDSVSGSLIKSLNTLIKNNVITDTGSPHSSYGVLEAADGTDYTTVSGNTITGTNHDQPSLSGAHSTDSGTTSPPPPPPPPDPGGTGTEGDDVFSGSSGIDYYAGAGGNDTIRGNGGNDTLYGGAGNDSLYGDAGDDILFSDDGNDYMNGGGGNDRLTGGGGNDKMLGGAGNDTLTGSAGIDTFQYSGPGFGKDVVIDFTQGSDRLNISTLLASNFSEFQQHVTVSGTKTVITFGSDVIELAGFTSPLQSTDVSFYS